MTRWEYVSQATAHLLKYKKEWLVIAKMIVSYDSTGTAKHTIASYLCSLIQEQMLVAHVQFLHAHIVSWWDRHFQWLKHVGNETQTSGVHAVHMPLQYFVQTKELKELTDEWKEKEEFADFVRDFPQESEYKKEELSTLFFGQVKISFTNISVSGEINTFSSCWGGAWTNNVSYMLAAWTWFARVTSKFHVKEAPLWSQPPRHDCLSNKGQESKWLPLERILSNAPTCNWGTGSWTKIMR